MSGNTGILDRLKSNFDFGEGKKAVAFGRVGVTTLGGALLADGLFRSKTNDGEDRSVVIRMGEVALGAAAAGAALFMSGKGVAKA